MAEKLLHCGCRVEEGTVEEEHLNSGPHRHKPLKPQEALPKREEAPAEESPAPRPGRKKK